MCFQQPPKNSTAQHNIEGGTPWSPKLHAMAPMQGSGSTNINTDGLVLLSNYFVLACAA
jgi:hypothetical protein